ncbi:hypothetical protein FSP39_017388, partial [Pinctada imbricata]
IEEVLNSLVLTEDAINKIMSTFEKQISYANSKDEETRKKSDLFWECTYVTGLLSGKENGQYLGLDLGSTNFRVVRAVFKNGFSFSFPSIQKSLKHSVLVTWTKSFKCPDGPGLDPVVLLEEAINRRGGLSVTVDVMARISDTTGTLMAGNYMDPNCRIGLILGENYSIINVYVPIRGSNACFVERVENYNKLETDTGSDKVLVNCEWGALGDNGCLDFMKSEFDKDLDLNSNHANSYSFEKLFSGYFLGELVRLVLVKLTKASCLFNGQSSDNLLKPYFFTTAFVTAIERDTTSSENTMTVLEKLELDKVASEDDIATIRETCAVMSQRGAYIVAAALAVLLNHINLPEVTIGIDGSLYEHHPKFHDHIMHLLTKLVPKTKSRLILVKDGSGQGSAFVAAVESQQSS